MQRLRVAGGLREPGDAFVVHSLETDVRLHDGGKTAHPEEMAADGTKEGRILSVSVPPANQVLARYVVIPLPLPHFPHEVLPSAALQAHLLPQSAPLLPDKLEKQLPHVLSHVLRLLLSRLPQRVQRTCLLLQVAVGFLVLAFRDAIK